MKQSGPRPPKAKAAKAYHDPAWERTVAALRILIERTTPWLLDLGNWIYGALIAFNLLILGALLTVGPVDAAVLVATAGIALALPPAIAGFLVLRFAADMKNVDLEEVATRAFVEAGFSLEEAGAATNLEESEKRRARVVLIYSYGLLAWTLLLSLIAVSAALWHMSWWIAVVFVLMLAISLTTVVVAIAATGSNTTLRPPRGEVEPDTK